MAQRPQDERAVAVELFRQASSRLHQGQLLVAARLSERARDVFQGIGDAEGACASASQLGRVRLRQGRLDDAHACFAWAREEAARRGLQARELAALTELGALHELSGQLPQAVAIHREVLERQRQRDDNLGIAIAAGNVGRLLPRLAPRHHEGQDPAQALQDDARALLDEARQRFEVGGSVPGVANTWICLGDLERAAGRLDAAELAFAQVVERTREGQPGLHALALLNLGHVQRDRGQVTEALATFTTSATVAAGIGDRQGMARARLALTMLGADSRPLHETEADFASVEADFRALGQPAGALTAAVNRAAILCRLGQLPEGRRLLETGRSQLESQGDRLATLEVTLALADIALTQGDTERLEALLATAPVDKCPPRLLVRRKVLEIRRLVRSLALDPAEALLATVDDAVLSASESLGVALQRAEIRTLRGHPESRAGLVALAGRENLGPREALSIQSALAADAFWRGDLRDAAAGAALALEEWQARSEPLSLASVACLRFRVALLRDDAPEPATLDQALTHALAAEARDLAASVRLLQAIARRDGEAVRQEREVLQAHGHRGAALIGTLLAAQVLADRDLAGEAAAMLASVAVAAPGWWNADPGPRL
jgi:tetratricopeptide (TPR) repeat protein